jgi:hypothetical protein
MNADAFGPIGWVGRTAVEHRAGLADRGVIGVSRRPVNVPVVTTDHYWMRFE